MDPKTRDLLVDLAPQNWREAQRRIEAVRTYLTSDRPTAELADRLAAEVGIRRSLFYRLASIMREGAAEVPPSGRQIARSRRDAAIEQVVADAIARCGPTASTASVLRTARAIGTARGVDGITQSMVRTRAGRSGAGSATGARLDVEAGFMLDRIGLRIPVPENVGPDGRYQLTGVVDLRRGKVVAHAVTFGKPTLQDVAAVLAAGVAKGATLAFPSRDACLRRLVRAAAEDAVETPTLVGAGCRAGAAMRAALGARLGRIELVERAAPDGADDAAVELSDVRAVVAELMRIHGAQPPESPSGG